MLEESKGNGTINKAMKKISSVLLLSFLFCGCASVPKETVMLSGEIGNMIQSAKESHYALLVEYEQERRGRIDDYMQNTWIPIFIRKMATDGDLWGKTCDIKNSAEATIELQDFVQAAALQIANRRKTLTDALDSAMTELRESLRTHYDTIERANRVVTNNIRSVRANDEAFEETLKAVKIDPNKVTPFKDVSKKLDKLFN